MDLWGCVLDSFGDDLPPALRDREPRQEEEEEEEEEADVWGGWSSSWAREGEEEREDDALGLWGEGAAALFAREPVVQPDQPQSLADIMRETERLKERDDRLQRHNSNPNRNHNPSSALEAAVYDSLFPGDAGSGGSSLLAPLPPRVEVRKHARQAAGGSGGRGQQDVRLAVDDVVREAQDNAAVRAHIRYLASGKALPRHDKGSRQGDGGGCGVVGENEGGNVRFRDNAVVSTKGERWSYAMTKRERKLAPLRRCNWGQEEEAEAAPRAWQKGTS